ncbi:MAG: hypothetical protein AAF492_00305 [Verrucomicrobiota bacterium]
MRRTVQEISEARRIEPELFVFSVLIMGIGLFNLLIPHSYFFFGINHHSFLSPAFQIQWILIFAGILFLVSRMHHVWFTPSFYPVATFVSLLLLFLFRTEYPTVHGDGEAGGSPHGGSFDMSSFPRYDGRLQALAVDGLSRILPSVFHFKYFFTSTHANTTVNNAWIFAVMAIGFGLSLLILALVKRIDRPEEDRLGLALLLLTSAPLLNAFGHFDAYIFPIALIAVWFIAIQLTWKTPKKVENWILLFGLIPVCIWAHPVLLYLTGYAFVFALMVMLHKAGQKVPLSAVILLALLFGCAPPFIAMGHRDLLSPANTPLLGWMLHERLMAFVQTALPAFVLLLALIVKKRIDRKAANPMQQFGLFVCVSMLIMFFSLKATYGLLDEFLYTVFAAIFIGGVTLLYLSTPPDPRVLLYCGLLSLFLYLPRLMLYAGPEMITRFETNLVHDPSRATRTHGPYKIMAMNIPINTEAQRERRLAILQRGIEDASPRNERFRDQNRAYHMVWAYEFGWSDRVRDQLEALIDEKSELLPALWLEHPDPFLTRTWHGVAHREIREDSRRILEMKLEADPENEALKDIFDILEEFEVRATMDAQ